MYYITVTSKNKNSIKTIFTLLNNINSNKGLNLNIIKKHFPKNNKKKVLTVLKSPHVNKTAQEQFEFKIFSELVSIKPTTKNFKFLLLLKKLVSSLFPDTKIRIKLVNNNKVKKQYYKIFNINNFFKTDQKLNTVKKVFNIFDINGELATSIQK